jgi:regulator of replication initiation timing
MQNNELIERLKNVRCLTPAMGVDVASACDLIKSLQTEVERLSNHIKHIGNDALRSENHTLSQQLSEAQAAIEASRKQEAVGFVTALNWSHKQSEQVIKITKTSQPIYDFVMPLYAAPVVAGAHVTLEMLADKQRQLWTLRD